MRVHEQIYTSAARLLEGGGNLGVVAESRGFPRALTTPLATLRGYTMLPRYGLADPAAHPPRIVVGPVGDGSAYAVTATRFAGADHTGRTTPLTHHVIADVAEARRAFGDAAGLLAAVWPHLVATWDAAPERFDPPREINTAPPPVLPQVSAALLPWLAGAIAAYPRTGRPVVVVIDPDTAAGLPAVLTTALSLLPPSLQWKTTAATHVVAVSDFVRDAALLFTYADSVFLEQCRLRRDSRAPLVLDAAAPPVGDPDDWGLLVRSDASAGYARTRQHAARFDRLDLAGDDVPAYVATARLVDDLAAAPARATGAEWLALSPRFTAAGSRADLADWIESNAVTALRTLAADDGSATRWDTLAAVAADDRWPAAARRGAVGALLDGGDDALDTLVAATPTGSAAFGRIAPDYQAALAARPSIALRQAKKAIAAPGPAALARAAHVLSAATPSPPDARAILDRMIAAPPAVRSVLDAPLRTAIGLAFPEPADLVTLFQNAAVDRRAAVGRDFVLPLLRSALDRSQDARWRPLAEQYRDVAVTSGLRAEDYEWLFSRHARALGAAGAAAWFNDSRLSPDTQLAVRNAAQRAGLYQPPAVAIQPPMNLPDEGPVGTTPLSLPINTGGVGPVRTCFYLATLVVVAGLASTAALRGHVGPHHRGGPMVLTAGAAVVAWMFVEIFLRLFVRSPRQFAVARWARRAMLLLLIAAIALAAWPAVATVLNRGGP